MRRTLLIAASLLFVLGLLGAGVGYWVIFAPNTPAYEGDRSVLIPRGAGFGAVTDSLVARGIVERPATFQLLGRVTGWRNQVKAGHYTFESGTSNYHLLDVIRKGLQSPVRLTIPPGTRPEVVAAVAGKAMDFSREDFLAALRDPALAAELDTDTTRLFGYMLPETYFFYWHTDAATVVRKVKEQFDRFYQNELAAGADSLGLSRQEVTTLASIVEWEANLVEEKPSIAGVYLNRLRIGMKLDADPTVQYGILQQEGQKRRLFFRDYDLQHPYNTYLFRGLPPGPLTNPSPSSLRAVVHPQQHDYLYFVATGDGGHTFSRTLREHNQAAAAYRQRMVEQRRQQQQQ